MENKSRLWSSIVLPLCFIVIIWCVKIIEISLDTSFFYLGIYPRKLKGLIGILTSPFIHENFKHLLNNTIPFFLFAVAIFYFYWEISFKVIFWIWIITGLAVWIGARGAYHVGASGIIYGMAFFLFFSGAIRKIPALAAVSLIVVFLYGGMIWGVFPFVPDVSWESHLSGGFAGLILAFILKNKGPQPKKYDWEDEKDVEEMDEDEINEFLDDYNQKKQKDNSKDKDE
jgi:membrane associated rhomboid family serine protease